MTEETMQEDVQDRDESVNNEQDVSNTEVKPKSSDEPESTEVKDEVKAAKEAGVSVEEFERTQKALAKANEEAKNRRLKLKEYEELGVDPEKIKALLDQQREQEIKQLEEEKRYDELLTRMRDESNQKVEKYQEENQHMKSQLERYVRDNQINEAIAKEDGIAPLLSGIVKDRTKVVEEEGNYKTVVLDEYGQATDQTVSDFVKSLKDHEDYGHAFRAPRVSGSGTSSQSAGKPPSSKPGPKKSRSKMSISERAEYRTKYGAEEYNKLPF